MWEIVFDGDRDSAEKDGCSGDVRGEVAQSQRVFNITELPAENTSDGKLYVMRT